MYRVLLADDEKVICEGLKALIDWDSLGYEVCACAKNGIEILKLAEIHNPHLLITDIKMPKMGGLEAVTELRRKNFDMEILILTGFADFDYAREALGQGACGYLMKPVDDEELKSQLSQIASKIGYKDELRFRREGQQLLALCSNASEHFELLPSSNLLEDDKYTLISAEFILAGDIRKASTVAELEDYFTENENECQSSELYDGLIEFRNSHIMNKIWITPFKNGYMTFLRGDNWNFPETLHKLMDGRKNVRFIVGETVSGLSAVPHSFATVESGRHQYFYSGNGRNMVFYEYRSDDMTVQYEPLDIENIISHMEAHRLDEAIKSLNEMGNQIRERRYALPLVEAYVNIFITRLALFMDETCGMGHELYRIGEKLKSSVRYTRIEDLLLALEKILYITYSTALGAEKEVDMGIIRDIINYLQENYQNKITLKTVSEHFFLNTVYLGQLFKRKMGVSFNEYLTQLRMDKAKQMLLKTHKSISEISFGVGFDDPNYFSAKFSKKEGITPREFRVKGK